MVRSVHTDAYAEIIATLVRLRKARGVTQVALAERVGKPQSFISEVETRERRLDILEFCALARGIGLEPEVLFSEVARTLPEKIEI